MLVGGFKYFFSHPDLEKIPFAVFIFQMGVAPLPWSW